MTEENMTGDSSSLTARYMSVALKQLTEGVSGWVDRCVGVCGGWVGRCVSGCVCVGGTFLYAPNVLFSLRKIFRVFSVIANLVLPLLEKAERSVNAESGVSFVT